MSFQFIEQSPHVADYVARHVGLARGEEFGNHFSVGVAKNARPVAGVVFNWFRQEQHGNDVRVSIAAEPHTLWATREVLGKLFDYPFNQWGCTRITAVVREGNEHSAKFVKHLGFRKEGVLRRAWDGKTNALIFSILKNECEYI